MSVCLHMLRNFEKAGQPFLFQGLSNIFYRNQNVSVYDIFAISLVKRKSLLSIYSEVPFLIYSRVLFILINIFLSTYLQHPRNTSFCIFQVVPVYRPRTFTSYKKSYAQAASASHIASYLGEFIALFQTKN